MKLKDFLSVLSSELLSEEEEDYTNLHMSDEHIKLLSFWRDNLDRLVILDTETTGVGDDDEIIDIALLDGNGRTLYNSLVSATIPISKRAEDIHGITNRMLVDAPSWKEVYKDIHPLLEDKIVLIYNSQFDIGKMKFLCQKYKLPFFNFEEVCMRLLFHDLLQTDRFFVSLQKLVSFPIGKRAIDKCNAVSFLLCKLWTNI